MAKLEIKIYPDKILKKKSLSVKKVTEKEKKLATDMIETMRSANGIGLAAPQVGIRRRIIVVEDMEARNSPLVLFNPKVVKKKGKCSFYEGCLSVPQVTSDITRPESVTVEAIGLDGKEVKIDTDGLLARVLQHEIDHLDGIIFIDRIGFLRRKGILKHISKKVCVEL